MIFGLIIVLKMYLDPSAFGRCVGTQYLGSSDWGKGAEPIGKLLSIGNVILEVFHTSG
jgi:hypothetical protein